MQRRGLVAFLIMLMIFTPLMGVFVSASPSKISYPVDFWKYSGAGTWYKFTQLDRQYVTLSNDRSVYAYFDSSDTSYIHIKIINTDGTTYGSVDWRKSSTTYLIRSLSLYYVSDTSVFIFFTYQYTQTTVRLEYGVMNFNPLTLATGTPVYSANQDCGGSGSYIAYSWMTDVILYNSKYYVIASSVFYDVSNGYKWWVDLIEYTSHTTATRYELQNDEGYGVSDFVTPVYWFQYSGATAYAMWASSTSALSYYTINLSAHTATLLNAHAEPLDIIDYERSYFAHFLGGDVITNGTDVYLYFTWLFSDYVDTTQYYCIVQGRSIYNTTISAGTLLEIDRVASVKTLTGLTGYAQPLWVLGYEFSKSEYYVFYKDSIDDITYCGKAHYTISDWFSTSSSFSVSSTLPTTESLPDTVNETYPCSMAFTTQWGFCDDDDGITILYRLASLINTYSVTGIITPDDSPHIQNKQYYLAISGKVNGLGRGGLAVSIIINSGTPSIYGLSALGTLSLPIKFTTTGIITVDIDLIDVRIDLSTVATDTIEIIVQADDIPDGGTPDGGMIPYAIGSWLDMFINVAPPMLIIFVPAGIVGIVAGSIGFVAGALLGVVIGARVSIFPTYVLYMSLLILGLLAFAIIKGGGSN